MSGPRTPYGYAQIFHDALASITVDSPAELSIEMDKHPNHLRSMFNQFRTAWQTQAAFHHKRKEYQQEKVCRDNYLRLMQYECKVTEAGIILSSRSATPAKLTIRGRVATPTLLEDDLLDISVPEISKEEIVGILNSGQVINDNPPTNPDTSTNKYGIPIEPKIS